MDLKLPISEVDTWNLEEIETVCSILNMRNDQHLAWRAYYEAEAEKKSKRRSK